MEPSRVNPGDPRFSEVEPVGERWSPSGAAIVPNSPPRWSAIAVTGFVLSFLLGLAPLGVVLGIVGIFRTRGGRRRGMGLAIAAIPIGLVVSVVVGMAVLFLVTLFDMQQTAVKAGAVLRAGKTTVAEKTEAFYREFPRFESFAPREEFTEWLNGVIDTNGSMTGWKAAKTPVQPRSDGSWELHYTGEFVNGTADVGITLFPADWRQMDLRDMSVDGVSAVRPARATEGVPIEGR